MNGEHIWGLDSHANVHITPYKHRFVTYRQLEQLEHVVEWQGAVDTAVGIGAIELVSQEGRYRLHDVYYAPKACKQLLSEAKLLIFDDLICTPNGKIHPPIGKRQVFVGREDHKRPLIRLRGQIGIVIHS
jgi:hypothetical protein